MTNITHSESVRNINGGKTYRCPFGCNNRGSYWSVYWHCFSKRCYLSNSYFRALNDAAGACLDLAGILSGFIK